MSVPWKALLVVYRHLDVRLDLGDGRSDRYTQKLSDQEVSAAVNSFSACPALVEELSQGEATMTQTVAFASRPLYTLSMLGEGTFWPAPQDTRQEFNLGDQSEVYHSFFAFWPQRDLASDRPVPSGGWGLGMGPVPQSLGMTYATVANAPDWAWNIPRVGEVWLHEWLHGVCRIFQRRGCSMPDGDADGGGRHGYVQSPDAGWCEYYRDLMTGRVLEAGVPKGITAAEWRALDRSRK